MKALTPRQREIVTLVAESKNYREIAAKLKLTPATVQRHKANISIRCGLCDVAAMTRYAIQKGWVKL